MILVTFRKSESGPHGNKTGEYGQSDRVVEGYQVSSVLAYGGHLLVWTVPLHDLMCSFGKHEGADYRIKGSNQTDGDSSKVLLCNFSSQGDVKASFAHDAILGEQLEEREILDQI